MEDIVRSDCIAALRRALHDSAMDRAWACQQERGSHRSVFTRIPLGRAYH